MNKSQLYIDNVPVPVMEELQININKLIADVREPDKRNTEFSNTVSIPGCAEIDKLFEFVFEANISLRYFNPNLKTPVSYKINNTEVIGGWLKLSRIKKRYDLNQHIYECEIKGHFSDLFYKMANLELRDLDFSEYDHILTRDAVTDSSTLAAFATNYVNGVLTPVVAGLGYRYPVIDFGYNNGHLTEFNLSGFRPILFAYEYLLKIFANAGKTFSSNFLSSSFFKTVAIFPTEIITIDPTTLANSSYVVGQTAFDQVYNFPLYQSGSVPRDFAWDNGTVYDTVIVLNDDGATNPPYRDSGSNYDTSTGEFYIARYGMHTIKADLYVRSIINTPVAGNEVVNQDQLCTITLDQYIGGVWTGIVNSQTINIADTVPDIAEVFSLTHTAYCSPGDTFRLRINSLITNVKITQYPGGPPQATGTASYDITILRYGVSVSSDPYLIVGPTTPDINETDLLQVNQAIPDKIKQKDFFKGIVNMFNLYVDIDKDNPNNYIIEPEPDFFLNTSRDWSSLVDISQEVIFEPIAGGTMKGMTLKYKSDGDYYNKDYQDQYIEPYGTLVTQSENQFNTEIKTIEVPFSPTPLVGNDTNKLIIPKIYKNDNGVVKAMRANMRIGLWNPTPVNINPSYWGIKSPVYGDLSNTEFPYCGHLDHPFSPTIDLNFDVPLKVYYDVETPIVYTTNNIWNLYYKRLFDRLTDKNSKRITLQVALDELQIKSFDFRERVFLLGMYCRVNAINNFNILENKTTEVELLKI